MAGILIVDDHTAVRAAVRSLLEFHSFEVCGEAGDGEEALRKARKLRPDIVFLDIEMSGISGITAAPKILRLLPTVIIIFMTTREPGSPEISRARFSIFRPPFRDRPNAKVRTRGSLSKAEAGTQLIPTLTALFGAAKSQLAEKSARRKGSIRFAWQQTVVEARAAPRSLLAGKINVAERAIAGRLMLNDADLEERIALKAALQILRQLISETVPARQEETETTDSVA